MMIMVATTSDGMELVFFLASELAAKSMFALW